MELQLIRNATMRIRYGSVDLLTDPLLAPRLTMKSYAGKSANPLVDLPLSAQEVISGAELTLLSHIHSDHFDQVAQRTVPRDMLLYCQPADEQRILGMGFSHVLPVTHHVTHEDVRITRTDGSHGLGAVLEEMGVVSGYILTCPGEPTVYWVGDSVLYDHVQEVIDEYEPAVIITHSSGAVWGPRRDLIVMDAAQTVAVSRRAPRSTVIAVHMEALDHGTVSRAALAEARDEARIAPERLRIPADGEKITLKKV